MHKHFLPLLAETDTKLKIGKSKVPTAIACCGSLFLEMATVIAGTEHTDDLDKLAAGWNSFMASFSRCSAATSSQTDPTVRGRLTAVLDA